VHRHSIFSLSAIACAAAIGAAACRGTGSGGIGSVSFGIGGSVEPAFNASAAATKHPINGKIVRFDAKQHTITLSHEAIPNYMDAMTMEFKVKEAWPFGVMGEGDTLRGELVVDGARSWIEGVTVTKASGTNAATAPRGSWVPADPGTPLPDVALVDQDGKPLKIGDRYRGHPVLMAFSYSRCPLPDYCPLTMKHFATIEKATQTDAVLNNLRLLTVTIDPGRDTPSVLRQYGLNYVTGGGPQRPFARWNLATGKPEDVKKLAGFFGLDYFQDSKAVTPITHSLRTAIVDPAGRVYKVFEGNEWKVDEVMSALRTLAAAGKASPDRTAP
jgi:protein SCO1